MEFLKTLKKNTLFIIPSKIKEKVLTFIDQNNILVPFKILEFESLKKTIYFDYNDDAVEYLKKNYQIKREVAKTYLKNLYYIDDSNSENMLFLKKIKNELEKNNLLYKNPYFLNTLNRHEIIIFGIDTFTKFELQMIEKLKEYTTVKIIENKSYPINIAYSFQDKKEEIRYVFEEISKLLKKNIPLGKIKIINAKEDDYPYIKRISKNYNIPVFIKENTLYATEFYKKTKTKILENKLEEIEYSKQIHTLLSKINQLQNITNLEEVLDEYAKEIYIDEEHNKLQLVDLYNNYFENDEHVFILNCNASILPKTYKDEDYLYDKIKPSILENTYEKTRLEEKRCLMALLKIKNKTICFIKQEGNTELFKSPILENIKIENPSFSYSTSSNIQNKKDYANYLDNYRKFGVYDEKISILKENYKIPYQEYNHKFHPLDKNMLLNHLNHSILLSYSSLNTFYECKFKYYLNYILKLKEFEGTYATYLGSLFHYVLEKSNHTNFNMDEIIEEYKKENKIDLSKKEEFFLNENKNDLEEAIRFQENFRNHTHLKIEENEKKLYASIQSNIRATLMGIIDKKWQDEENRIAVLDYKTGSTKINLKDAYHGLSMQLPIYYYLLRKNYPNMEIIGFYLQNILEKNFKNQKNKTKQEQKQNSLKWNGYSASNISSLEKLDPTYKDSRFISGLKVGKNGFYPYSKVLNDKQLNTLYERTDSKLKEMVKEIEEATFDINPKKLRGENISCKFCPYKSICFTNEADIIELEDIKTLEFLGGE